MAASLPMNVCVCAIFVGCLVGIAAAAAASHFVHALVAVIVFVVALVNVKLMPECAFP